MHADLDQLNMDTGGTDVPRRIAGARSVAERLRALPDFEPPRGLWPAIRARAAASGTVPPSVHRLALAAGVAAACVLVAWLASEGVGVSPVGPEVLARSDRLEHLLAENARLDALLAELPERSTTRAGTGYAVIALEDTLAMVDERLTTVSFEPHAPELAEQLWQERVNLMNSLVQVRYARVLTDR